MARSAAEDIFDVHSWFTVTFSHVLSFLAPKKKTNNNNMIVKDCTKTAARYVKEEDDENEKKTFVRTWRENSSLAHY